MGAEPVGAISDSTTRSRALGRQRLFFVAKQFLFPLSTATSVDDLDAIR